MPEEVFASYQMGPFKQVRVYVADFQGRPYIHIRSLFKSGDRPDWQYGKGLTIPYDDVAGIDAVVAGLVAVRKRVVGA
jgi:hypothetical protein